MLYNFLFIYFCICLDLYFDFYLYLQLQTIDYAAQFSLATFGSNKNVMFRINLVYYFLFIHSW